SGARLAPAARRDRRNGAPRRDSPRPARRHRGRAALAFVLPDLGRAPAVPARPAPRSETSRSPPRGSRRVRRRGLRVLSPPLPELLADGGDAPHGYRLGRAVPEAPLHRAGRRVARAPRDGVLALRSRGDPALGARRDALLSVKPRRRATTGRRGG